MIAPSTCDNDYLVQGFTGASLWTAVRALLSALSAVCLAFHEQETTFRKVHFCQISVAKVILIVTLE
jgi:hypothetical protein